MTALDASAVAALLREFGQRSGLRGGNPFRAKAYGRAADNALSLPLDPIIAQDRLREIPGIGDAIADIVKKLHPTGTHPALEKMRKEIPAGVLEMLTIPGLRADRSSSCTRSTGTPVNVRRQDAALPGSRTSPPIRRRRRPQAERSRRRRLIALLAAISSVSCTAYLRMDHAKFY